MRITVDRNLDKRTKTIGRRTRQSEVINKVRKGAVRKRSEGAMMRVGSGVRLQKSTHFGGQACRCQISYEHRGNVAQMQE